MKKCKHPTPEMIVFDTDWGSDEMTWWCESCGAIATCEGMFGEGGNEKFVDGTEWRLPKGAK